MSAAGYYRPGTVVSYTPDRHWCREGTAVADAHGLLRDTYWGSGVDQHVVTADEAANGITLRFHLDDYDELPDPQHYTWRDYPPEHRERITSQHGLQQRLFVRKGAKRTLEQQLVNARADLEAKLEQARALESGIAGQRAWIAELEQQAAAVDTAPADDAH